MPNSDEAECLSKWESFGKGYCGPKRTIRSLHYWAKQGGYLETTQTIGAVEGKASPVQDPELLPLPERINLVIQELLKAHLANDPNRIDAAFAEIWKLGVSRERAQERILMLWAEQHG